MIQPRRVVAWLGRGLGYLWSAVPMGVLGLLLAAAVLVLGRWGWWRRKVGHVAAWRVRAGAVEMLMAGPFAEWMSRPREGSRRWLGFTFGWTILLWHPDGVTILPHEHGHVLWQLALGPLYAPVYLPLLVFPGYAEHPIERACDTFGERHPELAVVFDEVG